MKASRVYRRAAKHIAEGDTEFGSSAIALACKFLPIKQDLKKYFGNYFEPTIKEYIKYYGVNPYWPIETIVWFFGANAKTERIISLLLVAELAKEDESGRRLIISKK